MEKKIRKAKKKQEKEIKKQNHRRKKIEDKLELDLYTYRGYYRMYFGNPYRC
ncbi:MAG: hypothetical protein ACFE9C_05755 [Candidatus Hodarchaeota archaeon]